MISYQEELKKRYIIRQREYSALLPSFCGEFFNGMQDETTYRTRVAYSYDFRVFFDFLVKNRANFVGKEIKNLTLEDLKIITIEDIEAFMAYISLYMKCDENRNEIERQNAEKGKSRKLSAIKSLFSYFYRKRALENNVAALVPSPKIHEKAIVMLEVDEVAKLLDCIEDGKGLTDHQMRFHQYTQKRDVAIITLFLGTGIRVSECVGVDISDVNFEVNGVKITRKGGDETVIYFGYEVMDALTLYLDERMELEPQAGHEDALFLSIQKRRITARAIQNLVKKYSQLCIPLKTITPHKLRSTFGTTLYRETGDIYMVADVLGHNDVNTTREHYAQMSDDNKRRAVKYVKLRAE